MICRILISISISRKVTFHGYVQDKLLHSFESSALLLISKKDDKICSRRMYQGRKPILRQSYILMINFRVIQLVMGRKPTHPSTENPYSVRRRSKSQAGAHHRHTEDFLLPLQEHMDLHGRQSHQCSNSLFLAQRLGWAK